MLAFTPLAGAGATGLAMFQEFYGDLVVTCFLMVLRQMVLKVVYRLLVCVSCVELSKNSARSWSRSSVIFAVPASFHKWRRCLTVLYLNDTIFVSTRAVS